MKELTKSQLENILKKKGLDSRISWFYIQFKNKYEEEFVIDDINLERAVNDFVNILDKNKIKEVLFFQEPSSKFNDSGDLLAPNALLETKELKEFLKKNIDTSTNTHLADKDLKWIFTITHEDDFFISGDKKFVNNFISFFKDAKCTPLKEIEAKWKEKAK